MSSSSEVILPGIMTSLSFWLMRCSFAAASAAMNEGIPAAESITNIVTEEKKTEEETAYITGEIEELRSEYSKTYEQSDGSRIAVMSAAPVHFYDAKTEEWKEDDNRLKYNEKTEAYESKKTGSDMQVVLPEKIDEEKEIEVEAQGYKVSVTPIDIRSEETKKINEKKNIESTNEESLKEYSLEDYVSDAVLDGKVEYTQDESVKVEYVFSGSGLKENIILSEAPEKGKTYSFRIKAEGLTAKLKKDKTIKLVDSEKEEIFEIPAPYMYDGEFELSDKIRTTLTEENGEYILSYEPDNEWLTAEGRVYPVTIDPTIDTKASRYVNKIVDTSTLSAMPMNLSNNVNLFAGAEANRACVMEAYIKFGELPYIKDSWTISKAELNLKTASNKDNKIDAYRVTSDWDVSTVYKTAPKVSDTILDVCNVPAEAEKEVKWDITNTVYDWYRGDPNYGIKLSSPYAKNNQSVFYSVEAADSDKIPYLSVEYATISKAQLENSRSVDIGRAGTAVINDFSGNVVLTREDIGVDGNVMPVDISMIYNLNNQYSTPFGYGFRTNYSQIISYQSDKSGNEYYEYICEDGSAIYFDYEEETGEYTDRSDRGYELKSNGSSANDLKNVVIKDSSDYEYSFDKYGRLLKITNAQASEKPSVNIVYTGDYTKLFEIDYITDGAGRKYKFNYTKGRLSDISYYGNSSAVLKKVSYQLDNTLNLKKVTYDDGKSISYSYSGRSIVSAVNTDGYRVDFKYTTYSERIPQRVSGITEYGSSGTKGADISAEYTPYQTKYTNKVTGDTETLVFSNEGDLISTYNSDGYVTVNEYCKGLGTHRVNGLVNKYEHKKSEKSMIQNGEFEKDIAGWSIVKDTNLDWFNYGHPGNTNSVKLVGNPFKICSIMQDFGGMGEQGDTYDIGGWAKANASPQNPFNITVTFLNGGRVVGTHTIDFNPYCTDWQYTMQKIQADANYTNIHVELNYSNQVNEALFDGITMYKGKNINDNQSSIGTSSDTSSSSYTEPTTTIDSEGNTIVYQNNNGMQTTTISDKYGNQIYNKSVKDNFFTICKSNEYTANGNYQKSATDALGNKTEYSYDENLGVLRNVTDPNGGRVYYNYDKNGNITDVYQYVTGLSNQPTIVNSYTYDSGDRLSKITHNGFDYDFGYSEFGLLESISAGNQNLISYGYDNQGTLTYADYGNGQSIDYRHNTDKKKIAVEQNGTTLYNFNYNEYGTLDTIIDNVTGITTKYFVNSDDYNVTEEFGDGYYHKFFFTEDDRNIEIVGNLSLIHISEPTRRS